MKQTFKGGGRSLSLGAGLMLGLGISLGITLILSALTAYLAGEGTIPLTAIGYCAMIILFLSAIAGAFTAQHKIKRLRLQICLASGAVYYISLIVLTALFFGGQFTGMGATGVVVACASICAALLANRKGSGSNKPKRRRIAV